ncbi:hypothetical protein INR49_000738 [Caranx melampygus]|nr:hypothetical protein INR49_000738 [Caranx melampygus]
MYLYLLQQVEFNLQKANHQLKPTLDENLTSLDVELLRSVSRLSCTLQDGGSGLRGGRAGHRQVLSPLKALDSGAAQLDGPPLCDGNCVVCLCTR